LDTDLNKLPKHLLKEEDPIFEFNKQIIDATAEFAVAYKPNVAFYEAHGAKGWESLEKTVNYLPKNIFSIADAKRGDIGNTSALYAQAFFKKMNFDAITVAPYMGEDSVTPFLVADKWVILLVHTSNPGSADFQLITSKSSSKKLFEEVIEKSQHWGNPDNMMYVVGATRADQIGSIRKLAPHHFFLVPGVGAQGGSLAEVSKHGLNPQAGLLVNSSRSIIYASNGEDFADKAREEAKKLHDEMKVHLDTYL
jgi:orotidine-5'-phosphate decarboxylase